MRGREEAVGSLLGERGRIGEAGLTGTISQSTTTQVSATVNRTYRIEATTPYQRFEFDPKSLAMKASQSQLKLRELADEHHDIVDVEVDSDMYWEADWDVSSHDVERNR